MLVLFVFLACTMAALLVSLFLTKRRLATLAIRDGHITNIDTEGGLIKVLFFILSNRYKNYSDKKLTQTVMQARFAFGLTAAAMLVYAVADWLNVF